MVNSHEVMLVDRISTIPLPAGCEPSPEEANSTWKWGSDRTEILLRDLRGLLFKPLLLPGFVCAATDNNEHNEDSHHASNAVTLRLYQRHT
jgi:hypothetical protein